jgi:hypothetical protein
MNKIIIVLLCAISITGCGENKSNDKQPMNNNTLYNNNQTSSDVNNNSTDASSTTTTTTTGKVTYINGSAIIAEKLKAKGVNPKDYQLTPSEAQQQFKQKFHIQQ